LHEKTSADTLRSAGSEGGGKKRGEKNAPRSSRPEGDLGGGGRDEIHSYSLLNPSFHRGRSEKKKEGEEREGGRARVASGLQGRRERRKKTSLLLLSYQKEEGGRKGGRGEGKVGTGHGAYRGAKQRGEGGRWAFHFNSVIGFLATEEGGRGGRRGKGVYKNPGSDRQQQEKEKEAQKAPPLDPFVMS